MIRPLVLSTLLAATALPALAEQVSYTWTPRDAREAQALSVGLALVSLRQGLRDGATVEQWGRDNAAALSQSGGGNWGLIRQDGDGHAASLSQTGGNNAHAIIQGGTGARADVAQTGGQAGITLQYGW